MYSKIYVVTSCVQHTPLYRIYQSVRVMSEYRKCLHTFFFNYVNVFFDEYFFTVVILPQSVEYLSIAPDPEQLIGRCYPMGVCVFRIPKNGIWKPDEPHHVAVWRHGK